MPHRTASLAAILAAVVAVHDARAQQLTQPRLHVLKNGLRVVTVEDHSTPLVTTVWGAHVGESAEPLAFQGNSHFLEHLILFRGSEKYPPGELGAWIDGHGGYFNGWTWDDYTIFEVTLSPGELDKALDFDEQMMFHASFKDKEFEGEKAAVLEEYRQDMDRPMNFLWMTTPYHLYDGETFYSRSTIGTMEAVQGASHAAVRKYYTDYYVPNNMTLAVVGDFDTDALLRRLEDRFSAYPAKPIPTPQYQPLPFKPGIEVTQSEKAIGKSYFQLAFEAPTADSPDYLPLALLAAYLTDGNASVLRDALITKEKVLDDVDFSALPRRYPEGWQSLSGEAAPDKVAPGIEGVFAQLRHVWAGDIDPAALESAHKRLVNEHAVETANQPELAESLVRWDCWASYDVYADFEARLSKVTALDVMTAARKYLRPDHFHLNVVNPKGGGDPGLKDRMLAIAGEFPIPTEAAVSATPLPNGSVVLHETRVGTPLESATVAVRAGSRYDGAAFGLAKSALRMMRRRTADRDRFALQDYLDRNGFVLSSSVDRDAAYLTVQFPQGKTQEGVALLREIVTRPMFPEEEWDAARKELAAEARADADLPGWVSEKTAFEQMFPGQPYGHSPDGSPETIARITVGDLKAFAAARYVPAEMALAYVGPAPKETVAAEWDRTPAGKAPAAQTPSTFARPEGVASKQVDMPGRMQANLYLAWSAPKAGTAEWVRWQLAQLAFGGDLASRLWPLRQKEELAYSVWTAGSALADQPVTAVWMGTALAKRERAVASLRREIQRLASGGLRADELERVKTSYLANLARTDRTADRRSMRLASWWVLGLPPTFRSDLAGMVRAATLDDVNRTVASVLTPDRYHFVDVSPRKSADGSPAK